MASKGPIKKNKGLRVLSGELNPTKENLAHLEALYEDIPAPDYFDELHLKVWEDTIFELRKSGGVRASDKVILEAYCTSYIAWLKSHKKLLDLESDKGSFEGAALLTGAQCEYVNPLMYLCMKLKKEMIDYSIQLGMTPMSRLRMHSGQASIAEKKVNIFEKLKKGK